MEPPKPPKTELPEPYASDSGSALPTRQLAPNPLPLGTDPQQFTLPSAGLLPAAPSHDERDDAPPMTRRGHDGGPDVRVIAPTPLPAHQVTMPQAQLAQPFRGSIPALSSLQGELVELAAPRLVRVRFPVHDAWFNAAGVLSGGFVVAMFDAVLGALVQATDPTRPHAVLETSARFFRSIHAGHVVVDATVVRAGRTTATIECFAWDTSSELCAKSSSTIMFLG